ncbi:MAG TPA: HD domain-containing protein [Chloroflexota bacterium]|nr:HD domain-containing protein [Chloroflexota bacterium]HUM68556.1 HD domain-containing protein [Chloroflexota bacterium]
MQYQDTIYGRVQISEPVLAMLMDTAVLQRLRGIMQHGISGLIGVTAPITRYEHSVGAMLLVRQLGGSLAEQIAALLHDASHTAFSHVIDYVVDGHDHQSYHDEVKEGYLAQTELPALLAKYGYDWRPFLDETAFPLLEQPSPRLCADRLDYFLRDAQGLGLATAVQIQFALDSLVMSHGRIAVNNLEAARWLGYTFIQADDASWANFREVGLYEVTAQAIRRALTVGSLNEADFWLTDEPLWHKLHRSDDAELQQWLALISPQTRFEWDEANPTFRVSTKLRAIDPEVLADGQLVPLSTLDTDFAHHRHTYLQRKQGKWPMRVVPVNRNP